MRNVNVNVLSGADNQNSNGIQIDANQLISASFQAYFGDNQAAGTLKLQASNDPFNARYDAADFTVTNWVDIPNKTASVSVGGSVIISLSDMAYRWLRAVYTTTATGTQTVHPVADVAGSLNNTYFLLQDEASVHKYYVWINVGGTGTDPMIAGRTGVEIDISANDTAATIGAAIATAVAALNSTNSFTPSGTTTVTITNKVSGPFVPMTDGAVPTGFTFAVTAGGHSTINVNMDALSV